MVISGDYRCDKRGGSVLDGSIPGSRQAQDIGRPMMRDAAAPTDAAIHN